MRVALGGADRDLFELGDITAWREEITRGVLTGHSNAAAEGINRLLKIVYRGAFGFTACSLSATQGSTS